MENDLSKSRFLNLSMHRASQMATTVHVTLIGQNQKHLALKYLLSVIILEDAQQCCSFLCFTSIDLFSIWTSLIITFQGILKAQTRFPRQQAKSAPDLANIRQP